MCAALFDTAIDLLILLLLYTFGYHQYEYILGVGRLKISYNYILITYQDFDINLFCVIVLLISGGYNSYSSSPKEG